MLLISINNSKFKYIPLINCCSWMKSFYILFELDLNVRVGIGSGEINIKQFRLLSHFKKEELIITNENSNSIYFKTAREQLYHIITCIIKKKINHMFPIHSLYLSIQCGTISIVKNPIGYRMMIPPSCYISLKSILMEFQEYMKQCKRLKRSITLMERIWGIFNDRIQSIQFDISIDNIDIKNKLINVDVFMYKVHLYGCLNNSMKYNKSHCCDDISITILYVRISDHIQIDKCTDNKGNSMIIGTENYLITLRDLKVIMTRIDNHVWKIKQWTFR